MSNGLCRTSPNVHGASGLTVFLDQICCNTKAFASFCQASVTHFPGHVFLLIRLADVQKMFTE